MFFIIDGYNLLFSCLAEKKSLKIQRGQLLQWMRQKFAMLNLSGIIVFDGGHPSQECDISYQSPLEIAYTPKGQSADQYIVERFSYLKGAKITTLVTNDKGLIGHCRCYSSKTMSSEAFIDWLIKKSKKLSSSKRTFPQETSSEVERLTKIFEDLL